MVIYCLLLFGILAVTLFIFSSIFIGLFFNKGDLSCGKIKSIKFWSWGAPWVPLDKRNIRRLLRAANLNENTVLLDLGSGDGKILIQAVREFNIKKALGVEISWLLCFWAKLKIKILGLEKKIFLKNGNFFNESFSEADTVVCYLYPEILNNLKQKFLKELRPGTLILSVAFSIPGWQPERVDRPPSKFFPMPIYIYRIHNSLEIRN